MLRSAAVLRQGASDMSSSHASCTCMSFNISCELWRLLGFLMHRSEVSPEVVLSCAVRFIEVMRASIVSLYRPRSI